MIVTTSRKPSRRTRTFAKIFCRFLGWKYLQRGKKSFRDLDLKNLCVISEIKGNPAIMSFYFDGEKKLEIQFSVGNIKKMELSEGAILFIGEKFNLFGAITKEMLDKFDKKPKFEKRIVEKGSELFFYFKGDLVFKMRIYSLRQIHQSP